MNTTKNQLYINGKWVDPVKGNKNLEVINPATEQVITKVSAATAEDVDIAVEAARKAFEQTGIHAWSTLPGKERAKYLRAIAKEILEKKENLGKLEAQNVGKPLREALWDVDDVAGCFTYYADLAEELDTKQNKPVKLPDDRFSTVVQYSAIGVVGAIIPWNYPLLMAAWKVAPALAAGCSIILKPSELTPLTAIELTEIIHHAGVPAGVFNLITGFGPDAGSPLVKHPGVDKVTFTGSGKTGSAIMGECSKDIKNVTLELGGKSPIIVFDDVDIAEAVEWIMFGVFWSNGQICSATSRLLVQDTLAEKLLARLVEEAKKIYVGDPFTEKDPSMGPLVSKGQYERVMGFIKSGLDQGAKLLTGGKRPEGQPKGYFLEPTIFVGVKDNMTIWKEEIFGPVLSVMTFKTEEEALRMANDTLYGLGAAVLSRDDERCQRIAKGIRAGICWINCSQPCFTQAPWGGMKRSGIGRELGTWGLDNFLEVKQVTSYLVKESGKWGWYIKSKI